MNSEDRFYKELASCPELPSGQFDVISKKINRKAIIRKSSVAGGLCFVMLMMTVGFKSFVMPQHNVVNSDVAAELQIVQDYLNGEELIEQFDVYAYFSD